MQKKGQNFHFFNPMIVFSTHFGQFENLLLLSDFKPPLVNTTDCIRRSVLNIFFAYDMIIAFLALEMIKQCRESKGCNSILKQTSNLLQIHFQNWQTTVKRFKKMTWPTTVRKKPNVQHLLQAKLLKPSKSLHFFLKKTSVKSATEAKQYC